MKKAGRLELQQDPFNVGQNLLVVTNAIALDDSVTDVPSHVISIRISGTWKELIEGGIGWFWDEAKNKFFNPYLSNQRMFHASKKNNENAPSPYANTAGSEIRCVIDFWVD